MDFKEELANYQQTINQGIEKYLRKQKCKEEVLNQSMEYTLMGGGKRLRPILTLATYKLFKSDIEVAMPYAVAIEMVHNFSLIHDDLPGIDNDDFRHGKPTNHKQFNEATAILAGDGLLNQAYMVISQDLENSNTNDISQKIKILKEFSKAIDKMITGEYLDTELEGKQITQEDLNYIHENKTGALLKISVRMGAILADCSEEQLRKLTNYAEKIGLAFQIKDDILAEEGDETILGKPVGNDRELGKCTFVSQYGIKKAKEILDKITKEAIYELQEFGEKSQFLKELALYIQNRNK
ncbi:MAG: polyprenyl synthetase family protein [Clostridia bacterium]|nr:polyprenyl synthetase family protein [Clostridia bacterium]